jgi:hypothetical protein
MDITTPTCDRTDITGIRFSQGFHMFSYPISTGTSGTPTSN